MIRAVQEFYEPQPVGKAKELMTWTERLQRAFDRTMHRNDEKGRAALVGLYSAYAEARDAAYQHEVRGDPYKLERLVEYRLFTWGFISGEEAKRRFESPDWQRYTFGE